MAKRWERTDSLSAVLEKIKGALRSEPPIREQVERAKRGLRMQLARLEMIQKNLEERDRALLNKVADAYGRQDQIAMKALSSELAELRKAEKATLYSRVALEKTVLRLEAAQSLDELARALVPAMGVMKSVKSAIKGAVPEAEDAIRDVFDNFNSALIGLGINLDGFELHQVLSEDAEKILQEAEAIAEQRIKERLPRSLGQGDLT